MGLTSNNNTPETIFTLYITGFGSFQRLNDNPSSLISSYFLNEHPPIYFIASGITYHIQIKPHPESIKVAYSTVDSIVPKIWELNNWDCILHLGAGLQNDRTYQLETLAHEKGYSKPDVDGYIPSIDKHRGGPVMYGNEAATEKNGRRGYGQEFKTGFDVDYLCRFINQGVKSKTNVMSGVVAQPSMDAGMYLCEYIFRASLIESSKQLINSSKKVMFMHIPYDASQEFIEIGCNVVIQLAEAMIRDSKGFKIE